MLENHILTVLVWDILCLADYIVSWNFCCDASEDSRVFQLTLATGRS
jgi:hypothetical protein